MSERDVAGAVTRVIRCSGPPAVVRAKTRTDVIVVIPAAMCSNEVLNLARLVLSGQEYQELRGKIHPGPAGGSTRAHQRSTARMPRTSSTSARHPRRT